MVFFRRLKWHHHRRFYAPFHVINLDLCGRRGIGFLGMPNRLYFYVSITSKQEQIDGSDRIGDRWCRVYW